MKKRTPAEAQSFLLGKDKAKDKDNFRHYGANIENRCNSKTDKVNQKGGANEGFSYGLEYYENTYNSTPQVNTERFKNLWKVCLLHYNWYLIFKWAPKSMGWGISTLFVLHANFSGNSDKSDDVLFNSKEFTNCFQCFFSSIL